MHINSRTLFVHYIIPAYNKMIRDLENFEINETNEINNATKLCGHLNDIIDYLVAENPEKIIQLYNIDITTKGKLQNKLKDQLNEQDFRYKFITNIADAAKHKKVNFREPLINSINDVFEVYTLIRFEDRLGYYYGPGKIVTVKSKQNHFWHLEELINVGMKLTITLLVNLEIIPVVTTDLLTTPKRFQHRDEVKDRWMHWKTKSGEQINLIFQPYKYDKEDHNMYKMPDGTDIEFDGILKLKWNVEKSEFLSSSREEDGHCELRLSLPNSNSKNVDISHTRIRFDGIYKTKSLTKNYNRFIRFYKNGDVYTVSTRGSAREAFQTVKNSVYSGCGKYTINENYIEFCTKWTSGVVEYKIEIEPNRLKVFTTSQINNNIMDEYFYFENVN